MLNFVILIKSGALLGGQEKAPKDFISVDRNC